MAAEPILHHYAGSPFAEKIRLILGLKGLAWRSVDIPVVMPKPDVIALTGGYRRTPVLQIGADVYCDTALIAQVLDGLQPTPPLLPASAPLAGPLAQWADSTLFWLAVGWAMQPAGFPHLMADTPPEQVKLFGADRASFASGFRGPCMPDAAPPLRNQLAALDAQLALQAQAGHDHADLAALDGLSGPGGPWLLGPTPTLADFALAHPLWFIRRAGPLAAVLQPYAALGAWLDRVLAIGHGRPTPLHSGEAVAVAAAASQHASCGVDAGLGHAAGDAVTVAALDYGTDPSAGTLVGLSEREVVIRRHDERAGTLHVHFPRQGFQIRKANT